MLIEKTSFDPGKLRGRPSLYPFEKLNPGEKLTIPGKIPIQDLRKKVTSCIYNYKKSNGLRWTTAVRIDQDNNIVVYRIS